MKKHFSIVVTGRVQGVFYRASAVREAQLHRLSGFASNETDGSVYIEAEGEEEHLAKFIAWCHLGPPAARVEHCEIKQGSLKGYTHFEIRR